MKIGDRCFVHGYVDEIRKDTIIIRNKGGYFGTDPGEVIVVNNMAHPNWIPCGERLPEAYNIVLVTLINGDVTIGRYDADAYQWSVYSGNWWNARDNDILAWIPLPTPYIVE